MKTLSTLLAIFRHLPPAEAVLDGMPGKVPSHWWDLDCVEVEVDSAAIFKLGNGREIRATEIKWDREAWNLVFRAPPPLSSLSKRPTVTSADLLGAGWISEEEALALDKRLADLRGAAAEPAGSSMPAPAAPLSTMINGPPEAASSNDPAAIALRERQKGGDDTAAAAAVLFNHPKITNAELALAVPSSRTSKAKPRSHDERGRLLRRGIDDRYPNFPADYSGP